jgi:prophage tail gpP-like protein
MADQNPEDDGIVLLLEDGKGPPVELSTFKEYTFTSNFLTPTDGFSFVVGDEALNKSIRDGIFVGQKVSLKIGGYVQAGGYIDKTPIKSSRKGGTEITISGRDWLSAAVDAHVDPEFRFSAQATLDDIIVTCFGPYGFGGINQIQTDDAANRNIITGQRLGEQTSKKGKPLKSFQLHQLKPWPREGVFEFCSRLSQRFGLWIWPSADGLDLFVSEPDFTQKPIYDIIHKIGDASGANYESGELVPDASEQPAIIVATGIGGGGSQPATGMKVLIINELFGVEVKTTSTATADIVAISSRTDDDFNAEYVRQIIQAHPEATVLPTRNEFLQLPMMDRAIPRVMYLHDDECKTPQQLEFYARRELALKQQHAFTATFTFERHTLGGVPWCVNAIANVDDDTLGLHNRMWVLERTFHKARGGGTTTTVKCILPFTLLFDES